MFVHCATADPESAGDRNSGQALAQQCEYGLLPWGQQDRLRAVGGHSRLRMNQDVERVDQGSQGRRKAPFGRAVRNIAAQHERHCCGGRSRRGKQEVVQTRQPGSLVRPRRGTGFGAVACPGNATRSRVFCGVHVTTQLRSKCRAEHSGDLFARENGRRIREQFREQIQPFALRPAQLVEASCVGRASMPGMGNAERRHTDIERERHNQSPSSARLVKRRPPQPA